MNGVIFCIILAVALFVCSYISKKRFGILGLALAAGYILSDLWQYEGGLLANFLGVPMGMTTDMVVKVVLTLLPAFILMFCGNSYKKTFSRLIGAVLFTLLALAFVAKPISMALLGAGFGQDIYKLLVDNYQFLIGCGLVMAVIDLLFMKKPVEITNKKHSH